MSWSWEVITCTEKAFFGSWVFKGRSPSQKAWRWAGGERLLPLPGWTPHLNRQTQTPVKLRRQWGAEGDIPFILCHQKLLLPEKSHPSRVRHELMLGGRWKDSFSKTLVYCTVVHWPVCHIISEISAVELHKCRTNARNSSVPGRKQFSIPWQGPAEWSTGAGGVP